MEFRTKFINKTKDWKRIPEAVVIRNGMKAFVPDLAPAGESGDTFTLVNDDPFGVYSPYSKVVFHEDRIEATLRKGWNHISPFKGKERVVEFELERSSTQSYALFPEPGEPSIILIPGIRRWLQVSLLSPYVGFSRVYIRQIRVEDPIEHFTFIEIKQRRPERELRKIRKSKEELLSKRAENAVLSRYIEQGF